jgi:hypothetical protein
LIGATGAPGFDGDDASDFPPLIATVLVGAFGGGMPPGILNHTLRFNGSQWVDSGVLTNDGTNIVDTGNFTAQGATHVFGNASGASDTNFTIGQGTTGFDATILTIRSGNGLAAVHPKIRLNRNGTDFVELTTDGTDTFLDYAGTANFRAGVGGATKVSFSNTGSVTAVGGSHNFGTSGILCTFTIGQGGTTNSVQLTLNSGNVGSGAPAIILQRAGANGAQWAFDGTNTVLDYTGILQFHSGVGGSLIHALSAAGLISNYKSIATVSNGVPAEYATIDRTGLTAAVASTLLYAVPAAGAGMYRISWVATVTTVATTSTLGGTNGFQIDYTDNDTNVAKLTPQAGVPAAALDQAYSQTNQGNTTATVISGVIVVNAKASTNINYRIDYTSAPGATMAYNLHIKIEAL